MTVALRGTPVTDFAFGTSTTVTKQVGIQVGDWLLWQVLNAPGGGPATITTPSGWTLIDTISLVNVHSNARTMVHAVFKRKVDGTEGSSFTATGTATHPVQMASIMSCYSGGDSTDIIDTFSKNSGDTTGTTITATGITVTGSGGLLAATRFDWEADNPALTGMTQVVTSGGDGAILENKASSSGATGNLTGSCSSTETWTVFLISLKAGAGAAASDLVASDQPARAAQPASPSRPVNAPWTLTALASSALSSVGFLDQLPRRSRDEAPRLRLATASDAQPAIQLTPYVEWNPPVRLPTPIAPRQPASDTWQLAAIVAVAASAFLSFAPSPARAAGLQSPLRPFDSGQALAPLVPFPSASPPPLADSPARGTTSVPRVIAPPDGSALAPLSPFPSTVYVPEAGGLPRAPAIPARPPVNEAVVSPFLFSQFVASSILPVAKGGSTGRLALADGSALVPLLPFPSIVYVPESGFARASLPAPRALPANDLPPPALALASLLPWFDPAPPPQHREPQTKRVVSADPATLAALPVPTVSTWADFSPLPPLRPPAARPIFAADPAILVNAAVLSAWSDFTAPPARARIPASSPAFRPSDAALSPLATPFVSGWLPDGSSPVARPAAVVRSPVVDLPLGALPPLPTFFDLSPSPQRAQAGIASFAGRSDLPPPALSAPFVTGSFEFSTAPARAATATLPSAVRNELPLPALSVAPFVPGSFEFSTIPARARPIVALPLVRNELPLPALSNQPFVPGSFEFSSIPARARGSVAAPPVRNDSPLPALVAPFAPGSFEFSTTPARARLVGTTPPVRNDPPLPALTVVSPLYFDLAPAPARGKPLADPPLPPLWFLSPLPPPVAPSAWADFVSPPARGFVSPVRAPAPPAWSLSGVAAAVLVPLLPSGEVVFNPTFPLPVLVPFIPSSEVVPPPSFIAGTFPPLIGSTIQVFEPAFLRRPDQILSMLDGGSPALVHVGASGKLFLTPLDQLDARTLALRTLRRYISLLNFRREVAPGEDTGRAFRLSLAQIHPEQPKDAGGEANLPSIAFLPGVGTTDTLGIGGVNILEDTLGIDGDGTAIAKYGEYSEQFTIEVVAATIAHRNGLVAGLKQALRMQLEWNETLLVVPELFGATAEFALDEVEYVEEPFADQNRRRALLRVTLNVPELFIVRGVPLLDPRVLIELGVEVVIEPRVDADEL